MRPSRRSASRSSRFVVVVVWLAGPLVPALAAPPSVAEPQPLPTRGLRSEPVIQRLVVEDEGARIEELRVRGLTQRIVVQPKGSGAPGYEILPPVRGRDLSTGPGSDRGARGQSVWPLLSF